MCIGQSQATLLIFLKGLSRNTQMHFFILKNFFFRINSLNNCINYGPNKTDKNSGLILFIF